MIGFALRRIAGCCATLVVAALLVFLTVELVLPANGPKPLAQRVILDVQRLGHGDLGVAQDGQPVISLLLQALGTTLPLLLLAMLAAGAIGVPLGMRAARRRSGGASTLAAAGSTLPAVAVAVLFASLGSGIDGARGLIASAGAPPTSPVVLLLPAVAAGLPAGASLALAWRAAICGVRGSASMHLAQAQGLTLEAAMRRHGTRSALVATLAGLAPQLALLAGGVYAAEAAFSLPGLSALVTHALAVRDLPLVGGGALALAAVIAASVLALDMVRLTVDPRIATRAA